MRLNKYLAQCGVCSRRDADKLIEQGKVLVNGQVAGYGSISQPDPTRVTLTDDAGGAVAVAVSGIVR